jgi:ABC-2 type transport system ATP-binding protein
VHELVEQYGDAIADVEVRRTTLEDTYMSLVRRFEPGADAVREFTVVAR